MKRSRELWSGARFGNPSTAHEPALSRMAVGLALCVSLLSPAGIVLSSDRRETLPQPSSATVVVVSTLHQLHIYAAPDYGFPVLEKILRRLRPDILAVELRGEDLSSRAPQPIKQEYQEAVFPFLRGFTGTVVTLEPEDPDYSRLVKMRHDAERVMQQSHPETKRIADKFYQEFYAYLTPQWKSYCDVNSDLTDLAVRFNHQFIHSLYPPEFARARQEWNRIAGEKISAAARSNPGKRIVVLMGFEHDYWLKEFLANEDGVKLLPLCGPSGALPDAAPAKRTDRARKWRQQFC